MTPEQRERLEYLKTHRSKPNPNPPEPPIHFTHAHYGGLAESGCACDPFCEACTDRQSEINDDIAVEENSYYHDHASCVRYHRRGWK